MADEPRFAGSMYCSVLVVDMVDSTGTAFWNSEGRKIRSLYGNFIGTISNIAERFGAVRIKTGGDSVICYFPKTLDSGNKDFGNKLSFKEVLECGLAMIRARCEINAKLEREGVSRISYRICADYGKHEAEIDTAGNIVDLYSPTMNMCGKMKPSPNSFVIGSDLHEVVKSFSEFRFEYSRDCNVDPKRGYPLYAVLQKERGQSG